MSCILSATFSDISTNCAFCPVTSTTLYGSIANCVHRRCCKYRQWRKRFVDSTWWCRCKNFLARWSKTTFGSRYYWLNPHFRICSVLSSSLKKSEYFEMNCYLNMPIAESWKFLWKNKQSDFKLYCIDDVKLRFLCFDWKRIKLIK